MKRVIVVLLLLSLGIQANSQDIITKKNGEDLTVYVQEVTDTDIKYVLPSMPDGPLFTISKNQVLMISYRDGNRDVMETNSYRKNTPKFYASDPDALAPRMKYAQLKTIYNYKDYSYFTGATRYSPALCGIASALIPGLGQIFTGEVGSGILQFAGNIVINNIANAKINNGDYRGALLWSSISIVYNIYSIVGAVRIAKVKNMYYWDLNHLACDIQLNPYVNYAFVGNNNYAPVAGLSMTISF